MPNIIPCRIWNYRFSPDAERRARQYPESDGRHPKWDAPEVVLYGRALAEAYAEAQRLRQPAGFHADASTDLAAIPGEAQPRVRQFPEPHRWTPLSLLNEDPA